MTVEIFCNFYLAENFSQNYQYFRIWPQNMSNHFNWPNLAFLLLNHADLISYTYVNVLEKVILNIIGIHVTSL
jgi:hypothetical protein